MGAQGLGHACAEPDRKNVQRDAEQDFGAVKDSDGLFAAVPGHNQKAAQLAGVIGRDRYIFPELMQEADDHALFGLSSGIQHGWLRGDHGRSELLVDSRRFRVAFVPVNGDARHQHQKQCNRYRKCHISARQTLMLMIFRIQILPITWATMDPTISHFPSGSAAMPCRYPGATIRRPPMVATGRTVRMPAVRRPCALAALTCPFSRKRSRM